MRRRRLTPDEHALWKRATRDVRRRRPDDPPASDAPLRAGETAPATMFPTRAAPASPAPKRKSAPPSSPFAAGDPALDRKARRGRLRPERTLDLHGLTQVAARTRLDAFLERAARDGLKCVLVVTGKDSGKEPARSARGGDAPYAERAPRGVLNRRFRDWLAEPPLRALVSRASPAAPADGGSGAFYVFLKARKG